MGKFWQISSEVPVVSLVHMFTGLTQYFEHICHKHENDGEKPPEHVHILQAYHKYYAWLTYQSFQRGLALIQMMSDMDAVRLVFVI